MKPIVQFTLFLIAAFGLCCITIADTVSDTESNSVSVHTNHLADSLQLQADSLEAKAQELEKQLESIDTLDEPSDADELRSELTTIHEMIHTIKERIATAISEAFSTAVKKTETVQVEVPEKVYVHTEEPPRKKRSGALCIAFEYTKFDTDPLRHLVKEDYTLDEVQFSFSDNHMLTINLMGYYSNQHNVRIGNALSIGYNSFHSEPFSRYETTTDSHDISDSIISLYIFPFDFGFLCEKALRYTPINLFAGFMIGGHCTFVVKEEKAATHISPFIDEESFDESNEAHYSVAFSPAVCWNVHSGIAFPLTECVHIGFDGLMRFVYAFEGFGPGFGDYLSVSPGLRMRLSYGRAG